MYLNLNLISPETLQVQIAEKLRGLILSGELPKGAALPSIRFMAKENRVSVITVQRAYEALEHEGVLFSRRAVGYFVADISSGDKISIAMENLRVPLEKLIVRARNEGLTAEQIRDVIEKLLIK